MYLYLKMTSGEGWHLNTKLSSLALHFLDDPASDFLVFSLVWSLSLSLLLKLAKIEDRRSFFAFFIFSSASSFLASHFCGSGSASLKTGILGIVKQNINRYKSFDLRLQSPSWLKLKICEIFNP